MKLRFAALAGGVLAAVALFATDPQSPAPETAAFAQPADSPDSVRIEHRVVRIHVTQPAPQLGNDVERPALAAARPSRPPLPVKAKQRTSFASRAVRKLVGDGTYTPEPFPQPRAKSR